MDETAEHFSTRKLAGIGFVALLHVAIIYALISGLGVQAVQVLSHPLEVRIIQEVKPPVVVPPPPLPPPPMLKVPPPFIPPPLIQIAQPPPPVPVIAQVTTVKPVTPPPAPRPAPAPVRSGASLDPNQSCAPPQYPEAAEDMGETGISILQFLIDANGNVVESRVASSSGHDSLDEAAEQALGACKFRPAIGADGRPQEAWTSIRYVWQLN